MTLLALAITHNTAKSVALFGLPIILISLILII